MPQYRDLTRARSLITPVADFPAEGVVFQDVMPLLTDPVALRTCVKEMLVPFFGRFDVVAGLEARGFLLAGAAAMVADVGLLPIRKAGKLPRPAAEASYDLEYGRACVEVQADVEPGTRVLVLDDVLATGGTLVAAHEVLRSIGCEVAGSAVLLEIPSLGGRSRVPDVHAVFAG